MLYVTTNPADSHLVKAYSSWDTPAFSLLSKGWQLVTPPSSLVYVLTFILPFLYDVAIT